jgi:hypothetical protein
MNRNKKKDEFIQYEILGLVLRGGFSRVRVYGNHDEKQKGAFRQGVRKLLREAAKPYLIAKVSSEMHTDNIEAFQAKVAALLGAPFTFGIAQKLLNLYIKYIWCLGDLAHEPPHCPVDSIVLAAIKVPSPRWPLLNREMYEKRIAEITSLAPHGIAEWELDMFNDMNPAYGNSLQQT